ncbi:MAG: SpaA isopeptide-forming pilin-related protein, partial [Lachnoclostridium edouardi]|uniref:SpaA isopeptide-forming pilin-related protein n=1 Tax=Lachnoclostridium edouardi TaxID=1926283 RepID=UPI0026DD2032
DLLQVQYRLKVGFANSDKTDTTNDPAAYLDAAGRTGFSSFKLEDVISVEGNDVTGFPAPEKIEVRFEGEEELLFEGADTKEFTIDKYITRGNSDKLDESAPYYTVYEVTVYYPYEDFVMSYNDDRYGDDNTFTIHNEVKLSYNLLGSTEPDRFDVSEADIKVKIKEEPAKIRIYKEIWDVVKGEYVLYNKELEEEYPGAAEFEIQKKVNGAWKTYDNYTVAGQKDKGGPIVVNPTVETDEKLPYETKDDGYVEVTVEPGEYQIIEKSAPGKTEKNDTSILTGSLKENDIKEVTCQNTPKTGAFKLKKVGMSVDGISKPLEGAVFGIYTSTASDAVPVKTATSAEDGEVLFNYLDPGTYYIKEIQAPEGYVKFNSSFEVKVEANSLNNFEIPWPNQENQGKIEVTKLVQNNENQYVEVPTRLQPDFVNAFYFQKKIGNQWVNVTDADGNTKKYSVGTNSKFSEKLPALDVDGNPISYRIVEDLPVGYSSGESLTDPTVEVNKAERKVYKEFTLTPSDTTKKELKNIRLGQMTLTKYTASVQDGIYIEKIADATDANKRTFSLYRRNSDGTYEKVSQNNESTFSTDEHGQIVLKELEIFKEEAGGGLIDYYWVEEEIKEGEKLEVASSSSATPDLNQYYVQNIEIDGKTVQAIGPCRVSRTEIVDVTAYNVKQELPYWVQKYDSVTGYRISGAEIEVTYTDKDGNSASLEQDGKTGIAIDTTPAGTLLMLKPGINYTVTESVAPENYSKQGDGTYGIEAKDENDDNIVTREELRKILDDKEEHTLKIYNDPHYKFEIKKSLKKMGDSTEGGSITYPEDIAFEVYTKEADGTFQQVADKVISSNVAAQLPPGEYYFKEVIEDDIINPYYLFEQASPGEAKAKYEWMDVEGISLKMELDDTEKSAYFGPYKIENATDTNTNDLFSMVNYENKGGVQIKKKDSITGLTVSGAELSIYRSDNLNNAVQVEKTSGGLATFKDLPVVDESGQLITYVIKETAPPDKYFLTDEEIQVTLEPGEILKPVDTATETTLVLENDPKITIKAPKVWRNQWLYETNPVDYVLGGVTLALFEVDDQGNVTWVADAVTDPYDGNAVFREVKKDKQYYIAEVRVPTKAECGVYLEMPEKSENNKETREPLPENYQSQGHDGKDNIIKVEDLENKYNAVAYRWEKIGGSGVDDEGNTNTLQTTDRLVNYNPWVQFEFTKLCKDKGEALNGAEFKLYKQELPEEGEDTTLTASAQEVMNNFQLVGEYESGTKLDPKTGDTMEGMFDTTVLEPGYIYWLVETKSASGHEVNPLPKVMGIYSPESSKTEFTYKNLENGEVEVTQYHSEVNRDLLLYNDELDGPGKGIYEAQIKLKKFLDHGVSMSEKDRYTLLGGVKYQVWLTTLPEDDEEVPGTGEFEEILLVDTVETGLESEYPAIMSGFAMTKYINFADLEADLKAKEYTSEEITEKFIREGDGTPEGKDKVSHFKEARFFIKEVYAPALVEMDTEKHSLMLRAYGDVSGCYNEDYFYREAEDGQDATGIRLTNTSNKEYQVDIFKWGYTPSTKTFGKTDDELAVMTASEIGKTQLSNVEFTLEREEYDAEAGERVFKPISVNIDGQEVTKFTTNTSGQITIPLRSGSYRLIETKGHTSYDNFYSGGPNDWNYRYFVVQNQDCVVHVFNPRKPILQVEKLPWNKDTISGLEGIKFTLDNGEEQVTKNSGGRFIATFNNLNSGTYKVTAEVLLDSVSKVVTDEYFNDAFQTNKITVGYWGYPDPDDDLGRTLILEPRAPEITGPTRTLKIYNPQLADIEIRKKDAKFQDTNLSGAVFKVYYKPFAASDLANGYLKADIQDDNYSGRPTAADTDWGVYEEKTAATNVNGSLTLTDCPPGWYMFEELVAPEHYSLRTSNIITAVRGDMAGEGEANYITKETVTITNEPEVQLELTKTLDFGDMRTYMSAEEINSIVNSTSLTFYVYKKTTDPLDPYEEVKDPDKPNKQLAMTIRFFSGSGTTYNGTASVWLPQLNVNESYCIKEVSNPNWLLQDTGTGWTKDDQGYMVLDGTFDGTVKKVSVGVTNRFSKAGIEVFKIADGEVAKSLSGAEFKLYEDQNCTIPVVDFTEEQKDGKGTGVYRAEVTMTDLSEKTYYLQEEKAPAGYVLERKSIPVTLTPGKVVSYNNEQSDGSPEYPDLTIKNEGGMDIKILKYGQVHAEGYDEDNLLTNPTVQFYLYKEEGNSGVWSYKEDGYTSDGVLTFDGLELDNNQHYAIAEGEIKNSQGYTLYQLESIWLQSEDEDGTKTEIKVDPETIKVDGEDKMVYKLPDKLVPGTVYECRAFNRPSSEVTIKKVDAIDPGHKPDPERRVTVKITDGTGTQVGTDIQVPYGGEGVKVYLQPGTYTFEEISITGDTGNTQSINEYVINKEDTRTIYQVTKNITEEENQTITLANVRQQVNVKVEKTVTPEDFELEDLRWNDKQKVTYSLQTTVDNTLPLDKLVITDTGLNMMDGNNNSLGYEDYEKDMYTITSVQLSEVKYKNYIKKDGSNDPADVGDILAVVRFYGFGGENDSDPLLHTADPVKVSGLDGAAPELIQVPDTVSGNIKSIEIEYYSDTYKEQTKKYSLPQDLELGEIKVEASVFQQPSQDGNRSFRTAVSKVSNTAKIDVAYQEWMTDGTQELRSQSDSSTVDINVNGPKAPRVSVEKSVSKITDIEPNDILEYEMKITNVHDEDMMPLKDPVLIDYLPAGLTAVRGSLHMEADSDLSIQSEDTSILRLGDRDIIVFPIKGELKDGDIVTVSFKAQVTNAALVLNPSIRNTVYMTSDVKNPILSENLHGASFQLANGSGQGEWPTEVLPSEIQSLLAQYPNFAKWNDYAFITANADSTMKTVSAVEILKEVKGNIDDHYVYGDSYGKIEVKENPSDAADKKATAEFRLTVRNSSAKDTVINEVRIMDLLPNTDDGRGSEWRMTYESLDSITLVKTDADGRETSEEIPADKLTQYYTTSAGSNKAELEKELMGQPDNFTNWKKDQPADSSNITGIAFVINNLGMAKDDKLIFKYTADLDPEILFDDSGLEECYYKYAVNSFGLSYFYGDAHQQYSFLLQSNPVQVTLVPKTVEVGGKVWLDDNDNGIQDDNGGSDYRNQLEKDIWSSYIDSVRLTTIEGLNRNQTSTDTIGTISKDDGSFLFQGLSPSKPVSEVNLYKNNQLDPEQLTGTVKTRYNLIMRTGGTMNSYPALTLKAAKHEMKDENIPNPEPNRSRKPNELQPGGAYEYEAKDNNFQAGGNNNYLSEDFFLWSADTYDYTKDLGLVPWRTLRIVKTDRLGDRLGGTKFEIYGPFDAKASLSEADVKDENLLPGGTLITKDAPSIEEDPDKGAAQIDLLYLKQYIIVEAEASPGYTPVGAGNNLGLEEIMMYDHDDCHPKAWILPSMEDMQNLKAEDHQNALNLEITNYSETDMKGTITLEKVDQYETDRRLKNAVFRIYGDSTFLGGWDKFKASASEVANGTWELEDGQYVWKEDKDNRERWGEDKNITVLPVHPVMSNSVFFRLDEGYGKIIDIPFGGYAVEEMMPPDGYVLDDEPWTSGRFRIGLINNGKVHHVFAGDAAITNHRAELRITKVDEKDSDKVLEGAKFILHSDKGYIILDDDYIFKGYGDKKSQATEFSTDADGKAAVKGLPEGRYTLIETEAPFGYQLSADPETEIEISDQGNTETVIENAAGEAKIVVKKVAESNTDIVLRGAEFGIYTDKSCSEDSRIGYIVTGDKGIGKSEKLPYGTYYLKETKAPEGYQLSGIVYSIELKPGEVEYMVTTMVNGKPVPYITNKKEDDPDDPDDPDKPDEPDDPDKPSEPDRPHRPGGGGGGSGSRDPEPPGTPVTPDIPLIPKDPGVEIPLPVIPDDGFIPTEKIPKTGDIKRMK